MECCDAVSTEGASVPYINQPSGICSSQSSTLLILSRDKASHLISCSPSKQSELVWRNDVKGEGKREGRTYGNEGKEEIGERHVYDGSVGDFLEQQRGLGEEWDRSGAELDGVECQIVYQADGSAYILENQSQLSCSVAPSSTQPQIINICHFASSQKSTLKSFNVFHPKNWCHLTRDIPALLISQSKDRAPNTSSLSKAELSLPDKEKPILVCFLCHLSFRRMHAFRVHISQKHKITLIAEELHLLSLPHTCAILHPVGPSDHPLLSFLEPKTSSLQTVPSQLTTTVPGSNTVGMLSQEDREHLQMSEPGLHLQPSLPRAPLPTSVLSPAKDPSTLGREDPQTSIDDEDLGKDGKSSKDEEGGLRSEVISTAENSLRSISSSGRQGHITEPALSNQSNPKSPNSVTVATSFMNNTKSPTDSDLECGTSFNCHGPAPVSSTGRTLPTDTLAKEHAIQESEMETDPNNLSEKGSAMAKEPNGKLYDKPAVTNSDLPNHSSFQLPTITMQQVNKPQSENDLVDAGRASLLNGGDWDFVVAHDSGQGSSFSFGGQITMTHSRNSCKTLKCPKCNWHYKYQQTLEAHMKEKHPDSEDGHCSYCTGGQDHPRLARGETYTCGYKPFRCQVCQYSTTTKGNLSIHMQSDKHLNNMQNLQTQSRPDVPTAQPNPLTQTNSIQPTSASPSKIQGRASWRCEVCDYETSVARNLRIHMTSEKHIHNMLLLQQNLAHMQRQHRHNATERYPFSKSQSRLPNHIMAQAADEALEEFPSELAENPPEALFQCALCGLFSSDSLGALSQHLAHQRSLPDAKWRSTTGDAHLCRLCNYATPLRANFQLHCQTDKHLQRYQLAAHLQEASRHHKNPKEEEEWLLRCVAAGVQVQLRCNACNFEASSMEKLKLHAMNARHKTSLKLYKYLQQFVGAVSDGGWMFCVLCNFSTHNILSLVQHSNSVSHQRGEGLLRLQRIQKGLQDEEEELNAIFQIRKSQDKGEEIEKLPTKNTINQEDQISNTVKEEEKTEGSVQWEKKQNESCTSPKRPLSTTGEVEECIPSKRPRGQGDASSEQVRQCPFCRFCNADLGRLRSHVMIQHAVQPTLRCPLCQDTMRSVALMRSHLTHLHSVTTDCTQKLINAVIASDVLPEKMFLLVQDTNDQQTKADSSYMGMKILDEQGNDEQEKVTTCQPEIAKTQKQPLEDAESTKENTAAFPCWQKGCNKVLTSSSALQMHINQVHSQRLQMPISDRHVYKYRCSQCSLAFKTAEKLQLHSQYHAIRAATMCCLCQRSFRTLQALQKHLETSHLELSEIQLQQICGSLLMAEELLDSEDQGLDDEQGSHENERVNKDEESDQYEKETPPDSALNLVRENTELNSKPSVVSLRKAPNLSTEKFLDPSRPFKCTVCKESFTQKNILLVHYNSVSHLHKVKRSAQESSAALPESARSSTDHKPFKCSICNVAYSQSSTLEIHMRSVLHQTKARAAKLDSSGSSSTSANPLLGKAVSDNTTASSTTVLKPTNVINKTISTSLTTGQHQLSADVSSSENSCNYSHSEESPKKQVVDAVSSTTLHEHKLFQQQELQQQQLMQAQAQIQQDLQKKAAFFQSRLFNPALLHHFPITTEALLPLQPQQQLLLPFLIPGEFQISPDLNIKGSGLNLSTTKPIAPGKSPETFQQGSPVSFSKHPLNGDTAFLQQSPPLAPEKNGIVSQQADGQTSDQSNQDMNEKNNNKETKAVYESDPYDDKEKAQDGFEDEVSQRFKETIPPRIAHDAPGNVSKALLENIGFELVMQFNENKQQQNQPDFVPNVQIQSNTKEVHYSKSCRKLECESCGKLFSNALILKSHKEHVHQSIFPIQSLEKFAKDYREKYDKLFPFKPENLAASPLLTTPASPPPLPSLTEPPQQKTASCISVSTSTVTSPTVSGSQISLAQTIPIPIDMPLFPPLMLHPMPLPALPAKLPVPLSPVEASLTPELAQLYQQQLTPALMQHQGKRPRTRITDDQLRILRQYFDINNSPNEDQIQEMANKSCLPSKVIKHWFRNTLFKERQRNKDSPYNFNNPPITTLEDDQDDSRSSSPEPQRQEYSVGKRSSRTRFTDYQLRVLQDFFDANAYPKDDEFEQLSNLLNLSTRVIVVWFQNARQKARKTVENQGEGGKDSEPRELSNDRYICTSNGNYECKKCSMMFQCIFDLIIHQKKVCYKDDSDEICSNQQFNSASESSSLLTTPCCSSLSNITSVDVNTDEKATNKELSDIDTVSDSFTGDLKQDMKVPCGPEECFEDLKHEGLNQESRYCYELKQQESTIPCSPSPLLQSHQSNLSVVQTSPVPHQSLQASVSPSSQQYLNSSQLLIPYHCIQCKLSFNSFEHWQEHQQMHLIVAQNHFVRPQFLDRPMDISLLLLDTNNPLLNKQVLSGAFPQLPVNSSTVSAISDSTINSLKRQLEQKSGLHSVENEWENIGDDSQRDKRMRTTITPEQLEILYQKYLLDSNPTRQMLDSISQEVGLKKRVVQVWFQNTRARERKGQFRTLGPAQGHRRCPFCRALFKAQTALDAHIRSRHWHEAKNTGHCMAISGITHDQEGSMLNFSNSSQMPNPVDGLNYQGPQKSDGNDNLKRSSISAKQSFEDAKLDDLKNTSMDTVPNGTTDDDDDEDDENYVEEKRNNIDHFSSNSEREASSESEDKLSSGLVSPAMSFSAKDNDNDNDLVLDYSESSSIADPASPCPGGSNSQNIDCDRPGHKRYRTQLSNLQVKVLKACFSDYKTPTMLECETFGNDIGLPKRVVQVWFQNARAKGKKAKLSLAKQFGAKSTCNDRPKTECTLCCVTYSSCLSVRDHVFSQQHLAKVKEALGGQINREREYGDIHQLMTQQEVDHLKKASGALAVAQIQSAENSGGFNHITLQYLNVPTADLQGVGGKPVANFSSTILDSSNPPSDGLISKANTSNSFSKSATTEKSLASTSSADLTLMPTDLKLQCSKENDYENSMNPYEKLDRDSSGNGTDLKSSISKERKDSLTIAASTPKPGKDYTMESAMESWSQLQVLQTKGNTDQAPFLPSALLPCLMPRFSSVFSAQIPSAISGSFLQPMFGMEGIFPYNPILRQALRGLSSGSILQQYQQHLHGALMHNRLQTQQKQLQPQVKSKVQHKLQSSTFSWDMVLNKELVLNSSKTEEKGVASDGSLSSGTAKLMNDSFLISQSIISKGPSSERGKDFCLYDCRACEISLNGNEELIQHLENPQHKHRAAEHLNAKEHASCLLPHVMPSSTSQPQPPSKQISSLVSQSQQSTPEGLPAMSHSAKPTESALSTQSRQHSQILSTSTVLSGASAFGCASSSPSVQVSSPSGVTSSLNDQTVSLKTTDPLNGSYNNDKSV